MKKLLFILIVSCLIALILLPGESQTRRPAFSPAFIPDLSVWLKADAITGLNDGDAVTTWNDSSASANNVTEATTSQKPLYKTAIVNGLPVVRFDGTDDVLVASVNVFDLASGYTIFAVISFSTLNDGTLLSTANFVTGDNGELIRVRNDTSQGELRIFSGGSSFDTSTNSVPTGTSLLTVVNSSVSGGGSAALNTYRNGTSILSTTASRSTTNTHNLTVGRVEELFGTSFNGDIAEIIIYNSVLSDTARIAVEGYLASKYRIY